MKSKIILQLEYDLGWDNWTNPEDTSLETWKKYYCQSDAYLDYTDVVGVKIIKEKVTLEDVRGVD